MALSFCFLISLKFSQDCVKPFWLAVRIWQHTKFLKRAGQFNKAGGAAGTKAGELALRCPACPNPGINMPPGWESDKEQYVVTVYLTVLL
jgi:hypothetical protein